MDENVSRSVKEYEDVKNRMLQQSKITDSSDPDNPEEISLLDYLKYLKNPVVLENPSVSVMVLSQYLKKIYRTLGIPTEDEDDIFRVVHRQKRQKIQHMVQARKEVSYAVKTIFTNIDKLRADKLSQFFSFLVRSGFQEFSEKDIRVICE